MAELIVEWGGERVREKENDKIDESISCGKNGMSFKHEKVKVFAGGGRS